MSEKDRAWFLSVVASDERRVKGHIKPHEIPSERDKTRFYHKGGLTLDQVSLKGCGYSICGEIQGLTRHG